MSRSAVQPNATLTARIINPALRSVIETFDTMLGTSVERGAVELRCPNAESPDVSALIQVSGKAKGLICLGFDQQTALSVVERFLGERPAQLDGDASDALGELANIVGGSTKSKLNMGLNIGLPSVLQREEGTIDFPSESRPMRVFFDSELGPLFVDFGFVVRTL